MTTNRRFETRGVLAGAYADQSLKNCLTHSVELDEAGNELAVLCPNVQLDNMVDHYGMSAEERATEPTCATCAKRLLKLTFRPLEIEYLVPGKGWKRSTARTNRQLDKLLDKLETLGCTQTRSRAAES